MLQERHNHSIFYHLLPTLHSFGPHEAGKHSKSIWVYIIEPPNHWKKYYPPKKHAIFLDPKPLHPPKKLAVHNRQCNPMILEARLSIEMKENLRKPGGETRLCSQTQGAWERLCKKIHYICKLQQDLMHLNSFILLPASQSHANTQIHPRSASQSLLVRNLCLPGTFSLTWLRSLKSLIQAGKILDGMNKKCTHQLNQTDIMTSNNLQIIS